MTTNGRIKQLKVKLKDLDDDDYFECDEEGRAIIEVGAENYDDIFSPYCYKGGDTLSLELVEYLKKQSGTIPLDYDLNVRFNVKNADEKKRKEIQMAVKENYEIDYMGIEQKINNLNLLSAWFIILGVVFMAIYIAISYFLPMAFTYLVDILSWLFIWEGVRGVLLDRRDLKIAELKMLRLASAKVTIKEFEIY